MTKKLLIQRNNQASTYAVHMESGDPPEKSVGGLSLDLERLRIELSQHSCSEEAITRALEELATSDSTVIYDCA